MWISLRGCNVYIGKVFCLRGWDEQRNRKSSQFVHAEEPNRYIYTEHGSKNRSGGLAKLNIANKQVVGYATPNKKPRCIVFLLDLYMSKLPKYTFEKDVFIFVLRHKDHKMLICRGITVSQWGKISYHQWLKIFVMNLGHPIRLTIA